VSYRPSLGSTRNSTSFEVMPPTEVIFGRSRAMQEIRQRLERIATADAPLMLYGESGTGKDIVGRMVHQQSAVAGRFVKVSCPAIPGGLLESELFGYEKGAFTGANSAKLGRVEMAHGGTLFLDEVSEIDISLQPKLLQLLQDGRFCRIGGFDERVVRIRLICASNRDLLEEVALGRFREDLYFRINVLSLRMPPLRERSEDIPILVEYFLKTLNRSFGRTAVPISPTLMRILQAYHWPGNIRELENLMKRYVVLGSEEAITSELRAANDLPFDIEFPLIGDSVALKELTKRAVARLERTIILRVLQAHQWNRKKAAAALKISYRSLLYKLKEVGVPPSRGIYAFPNHGNGVKANHPEAEATKDFQHEADLISEAEQIPGPGK
jgi:two-component system response regulator AtoC